MIKRNSFAIYIVYLWIILVCSRLYAQPSVPTQYLGIEHGLSNNAVTTVFQDSKGFMWFGTYDGLNRYNGYGFQTFRHIIGDSLSLPNNRVECITEDTDKNIWIGTKNGAAVYNTASGKFKNTLLKNGTSIALLQKAINGLALDNKGNIFIATGGLDIGGLLRYNKEKGYAEGIKIRGKYKNNFPVGYYVQTIQLDQETGKIWMMVEDIGLCLFNPNNDEVEHIFKDLPFISCILPQTNYVWMGGPEGLFALNKQTMQLAVSPSISSIFAIPNIVSILMDNMGLLWIGTDGEGVKKINIAAKKIEDLELAGNDSKLTSQSVYDIYQDKEQRIWLGTLRGGINVIDQNKKPFSTISHIPGEPSLLNNFVLSFTEDKTGNIWIGTDGGGLSYWNRQSNLWQSYTSGTTSPLRINNNFVTSVIVDNEESIWIGTYGGGISRKRKGNAIFEPVSMNPLKGIATNHYNVWTLYIDKEHNIWAGLISGKGLLKWNAQANYFQEIDKSPNDILTITQTSAGKMWVGTYTDLASLKSDGTTKDIIYIGASVRRILPADNDHLWVATEGKGLLYVNTTTKAIISYTQKDGLSNNAVLSVEEDKNGNLWLATFEGLSVFNPKSKTFTNYYESDGLQSNQFNYNASLKLKDGSFLFGGIKGFNIFNPASIQQYKNMPNLWITDIKVNNILTLDGSEYISETSNTGIESLRIPYNQASVSIDFAALEYTAPDKIQYAYKLDGWDKNWNYNAINNRSAVYSQLPPGNYTLLIKNTNAEGVWNEQVRTLSITILPPWYQTWWAYLIYITFIILGIRQYILYQKRKAHLLYKIRITELNAEKDKELNEKKLTFFTNISHEFRTPLTLIINPLKDIIKQTSDAEQTQELKVVYRNAKRLLSLADQLLLFRKAENEADQLRISQFDFSDICREVYWCFSQVAESRKFDYQFIGETPVIIYADREKIEIALFNLISNAFKYTPDNGTVTVMVQHTANTASVIVTDSGSGIPKHIGDKLFDKFFRVNESNHKSGFGIGLFVARSFIELHKGKLSYHTPHTGGTSFTMSLQLGTEHFGTNVIFENSTGGSALLEELNDIEVIETENLPRAAFTNEAEDKDGLTPLIKNQQTILIVDDNDTIRNYLLQLFGKIYNTIEASDGKTGLELAKKYMPDLIISDVVMEGGSGTELCKNLKEDTTLRHIPLILLTANSAQEARLEGLTLGADDYITKPFDREILTVRVENLLKKNNSMQQYFFNEVTLQKSDFSISEEYKHFLDRCIELVEEHIDNDDFSIQFLAREMGMSHSNLYKKVKAISGQSVNAFIRLIRLRKAATILLTSDTNINEAAFQAGIADVKYFRKQFQKVFGMNPSEYVKKYKPSFEKKYTLNKKIRKDKD